MKLPSNILGKKFYFFIINEQFVLENVSKILCPHILILIFTLYSIKELVQSGNIMKK
jgi:hypothetical protein